MTPAAISNSRRDWLAMCLAALPCAAPPDDSLAFRDLPPPAVAIARDLGLNGSTWLNVADEQRRTLPARIEQGSAEHVTYYVLQSQTFTSRPSIDPVRLAASQPSKAPPEILARFQDFASPVRPTDERYRIVAKLFADIRSTWTAERCFRHTMDFLGTRSNAIRDGTLSDLYQHRGLSTDTIPAQTAVLEHAFATIGNELSSAPMLLVGPGLDLTRRENFSDSIPLKSHQADLLSSRGTVECMDIRTEVVEFLIGRGQCAFLGDITRCVPGRNRYSAAFATNVLLYLSDKLLFLAMAVVASSLRPGGYFVHNDQRFAAKVFGESLGMPVLKFEPVTLGVRQGVEQMDRAVIHRRTVATERLK